MLEFRAGGQLATDLRAGAYPSVHSARCLLDSFVKVREVVANGFPDKLKIHFEITVSHCVSHLICRRKRELRMCFHKFGIALFDVITGLANDLEVADDGVLHQFASEESKFIHVSDVELNALNRFENVG